ncbi:hypothetical protein LV75_005883 [Actinokineospora diospyrosa]|uniref:Uncharacterized protein n=1 Tax=Actinokineospora diospyrosa TaxID=103728 RepID=A0ABT1IL29_9PSEU|nr:hypothetical protein [Actinokineospora diospyrosa]
MPLLLPTTPHCRAPCVPPHPPRPAAEPPAASSPSSSTSQPHPHRLDRHPPPSACPHPSAPGRHAHRQPPPPLPNPRCPLPTPLGPQPRPSPRPARLAPNSGTAPACPSPHHTTGGVPSASLPSLTSAKGVGRNLWTTDWVVDNSDLDIHRQPPPSSPGGAAGTKVNTETPDSTKATAPAAVAFTCGGSPPTQPSPAQPSTVPGTAPARPSPHHTTGGVPSASLPGPTSAKGVGRNLWITDWVVDNCDMGIQGRLGPDSPSSATRPRPTQAPKQREGQPSTHGPARLTTGQGDQRNRQTTSPCGQLRPGHPQTTQTKLTPAAPRHQGQHETHETAKRATASTATALTCGDSTSFRGPPPLAPAPTTPRGASPVPVYPVSPAQRGAAEICGQPIGLWITPTWASINSTAQIHPAESPNQGPSKPRDSMKATASMAVAFTCGEES